MTKPTKSGTDRVYIVDDDDGSREALATLMSSVGMASETCASPIDFLNTFDSHSTGAVILDVRLPGMGGLEVLKTLREERCSIPVIMITGYGDVPSAVKAVKLGAVDYLEKPVSPQGLLDLVQKSIAEHRATMTSDADNAELKIRFGRLSAREMEVAGHLVEGRTNKEIARLMDLSPRTVEKHRINAVSKMGATSTIEFVRLFDRLNGDRD